MGKKKNIDFLEEPIFEDTGVYDIMFGRQYEPYKRMKLFDPDEYEKFTQSWIYGCRKKLYKSVENYGKSGDKGRDIVGYKKDGEWDNYQCKNFAKALSPSTIQLEVGKLIYYTQKGEYEKPSMYYFVSPKGISNDSRDLLNDSNKLKEVMIEKWDTVCSKKITKTKVVKMNNTLKEYIDKFNFRIFSSIDNDQMINELKGTKYYSMFFGGGFSKPRKGSFNTPEEIQQEEHKYISCLLAVYSEFNDEEIHNIDALINFKDDFKHFREQRIHYYSAESLKIYARDSLPTNGHFDKLKEDLYWAISTILRERHDNGYACLGAVQKHVSTIDFSSNILNNVLRTRDRLGICHHLSNDGEVEWVKKNAKV